MSCWARSDCGEGRATGQAAMDALIIDAGVNPPGHRIHLLAMSDFFQCHTAFFVRGK